jgi:hypothetical protein
MNGIKNIKIIVIINSFIYVLDNSQITPIAAKHKTTVQDNIRKQTRT